MKTNKSVAGLLAKRIVGPLRSLCEEQTSSPSPSSIKGRFHLLRTCTATMNLVNPRILNGFRNKAQGCEERATLGLRRRASTTLKGLRPVCATRRFMGRKAIWNLVIAACLGFGIWSFLRLFTGYRLPITTYKSPVANRPNLHPTPPIS